MMTAFSYPLRVRFLVVSVALAPLAATVASAQVPAQTKPSPPMVVQQMDAPLALGEEYALTAGRAQVSERYDGNLVLTNRNWMVLRRVSEGRQEQAAPIVGVIPYIERHFKNVSIGRQEEFIWIPRSAVSKTERLSTSTRDKATGIIQAAAHTAPQGAAPPLGTDCSINIVDARQLARHQGRLAKLGGGKLTLACQRAEIRERPPGGMKRAPIFAELFTTDEVVMTTTLQTHSLDKVLSICVPIQQLETAE
jgi:hypothetical protein